MPLPPPQKNLDLCGPTAWQGGVDSVNAEAPRSDFTITSATAYEPLQRSGTKRTPRSSWT